jgi:hypothetical protein
MPVQLGRVVVKCSWDVDGQGGGAWCRAGNQSLNFKLYNKSWNDVKEGWCGTIALQLLGGVYRVSTTVAQVTA